MHLRRAALFYLCIHRISYGNSLLILTCTQSGEPIAARKLYLSAIGAARLVNAASTHHLTSSLLSSSRFLNRPVGNVRRRIIPTFAFDLSHNAAESREKEIGISKEISRDSPELSRLKLFPEEKRRFAKGISLPGKLTLEGKKNGEERKVE